MSLPINARPAVVFRSIRTQIEGMEALLAESEKGELGDAISRTVDAIARSKGRLIVTGMGKSGLVGRKIAATMASTGTPSMYIHPGEASHGDMGMITSDDMILALSWSGETTELRDLITYSRRFKVLLVVMTSRADSSAGKAADICLTLPRVMEACPNNLVPTTSTTIQMVMGDALAVALIEQRGFSPSEFHQLHPGGKLGAQLLTVADIMATGESVPVIGIQSNIADATIEMSRKRYGSTAVVDQSGGLRGVFTDGDLRRTIRNASLTDNIADHMTINPLWVGPHALASEALRIMNQNAVSMLFVCEGTKLVGAIHIHDVLRASVA